MDFDDIFEGAGDTVLAPQSVVSHNSPSSSFIRAIANSQGEASRSYFTTSLIGLLFILAIYWIVSFSLSYKQKLNRLSIELAQRRRHGIPDNDKRPFAEAYQDAVNHRRPLVRPKQRPVPDIYPVNGLRQQGAYDPFGRTLRDQQLRDQDHTLQRLPMVERNSLPEHSTNPTSLSPSFQPTFPLALPVDPSAQENIPVSRYEAPSLTSVPRSSALPNKPIPRPSDIPRPLAPPQRTVNPFSPVKKGAVKRLYMDRPEEAELATTPTAAAFSLPKRPRKNTWGTDAKPDGNEAPQWVAKHAQEQSRKEKRPAHSADDATLERTRPKAGGKRPRPTILDIETSNLPSDNPTAGEPPSPSKKNVSFAPSTGGGKKPGSKKSARPSSKGSMQASDGDLISDSRGQKRDRDEGEPGDEETESRPLRKRGREPDKEPLARNGDPEEIPEIKFVVDPLCGGRKPGEEWESGDLKFKVGPDGRRLQRGTILEKRPKYHMPADSAHQDHGNMMEVLVEKWYTQEEYIAAKAAGVFAWQQAAPPAPTPTAPELSPARPRRPFGRSSASFWDLPEGTAKTSPVRGVEINPFELGDAPVGRLTPSRTRQSLGSSTTNPLGVSQHATSTRWQKQAAEQEALRKLQEARSSQTKRTAAPAARSGAPSTQFTPPSSFKLPPKPTASNPPSLTEPKHNLAEPASAAAAPIDNGKKTQTPTTSPFGSLISPITATSAPDAKATPAAVNSVAFPPFSPLKPAVTVPEPTSNGSQQGSGPKSVPVPALSAPTFAFPPKFVGFGSPKPTEEKSTNGTVGVSATDPAPSAPSLSFNFGAKPANNPTLPSSLPPKPAFAAPSSTSIFPTTSGAPVSVDVNKPAPPTNFFGFPPKPPSSQLSQESSSQDQTKPQESTSSTVSSEGKSLFNRLGMAPPADSTNSNGASMTMNGMDSTHSSSNDSNTTVWGGQQKSTPTFGGFGGFGMGSQQRDGAPKSQASFSFKGAAARAENKSGETEGSVPSAPSAFPGFGSGSSTTTVFGNGSSSTNKPSTVVTANGSGGGHTSVHKKWTNPDLQSVTNTSSSTQKPISAFAGFGSSNNAAHQIQSDSTATQKSTSVFGGFGVSGSSTSDTQQTQSGSSSSPFSSMKFAFGGNANGGFTSAFGQQNQKPNIFQNGPGALNSTAPTFQFGNAGNSSSTPTPAFGAASTQPTSTFGSTSTPFGSSSSTTTPTFGTGAAGGSPFGSANPPIQPAFGQSNAPATPGGMPSTPSAWTPPVPPRFVPGVAAERPPGAPPPAVRSRSRSTRPSRPTR